MKRELVHTPEAAKSILGGFLGVEAAEEVLLRAASPEVKERLVRNTDEAVEEGAFGLPWFKATRGDGGVEWFWGFDHLGQVCEFLGLEKPKGDGGWRAML